MVVAAANFCFRFIFVVKHFWEGGGGARVNCLVKNFVLNTNVLRRHKSPNKGSINFSPFSRSRGLIEITVLGSPSVLFFKLKTSNRELIYV